MPTQSTKPLSIAMIGLRGVPATYGGVERAVEELSAGLADRGHRVTVYARKAYSDPAVTDHRGVDVLHLGQVNTKHLEAITHTAHALQHALRSRRFDVIHLHATGPALLSGIPRVARVPVVATVQGLDYRREKWGPVARAALRVAARASATIPDRTIVVSRELQRFYRESFGAETEYIPNGVQVWDEPHEEPAEDIRSDSFVLYLGRIVPEKHVHTLVRAYRHVETDLPLVIAGPNSHSPDYVREVEKLAAPDHRVHLLGPRYGGEKAWLMHHALAFVQASSIEGLPIALLEALAAGRFPIVSEIPENLEPVTVDGGERLGLKVPVDDEHALAAAITEAMRMDPQDRAAAGRRLQQHVLETYNWEGIAERTEAVYRDVVDGRARRA